MNHSFKLDYSDWEHIPATPWNANKWGGFASGRDNNRVALIKSPSLCRPRRGPEGGMVAASCWYLRYKTESAQIAQFLRETAKLSQFREMNQGFRCVTDEQSQSVLLCALSSQIVPIPIGNKAINVYSLFQQADFQGKWPGRTSISLKYLLIHPLAYGMGIACEKLTCHSRNQKSRHVQEHSAPQTASRSVCYICHSFSPRTAGNCSSSRGEGLSEPSFGLFVLWQC